MKRIALLMGALLMLLPAALSAAVNLDNAVAVAEAWLEMVDKGKYLQSWREASPYFQNSVSKQQWQTLLQAHRQPLGQVIQRTLKTRRFVTQLDGAPDGEYVIIQFETIFTNQKKTIETITPLLGKDGQWRVAGYYIK
jgi:hypothetical protein